MAVTVGRLTAILTLNTKQFTRQLNISARQMQKFGKQAQTVGRNVTTLAAPIGLIGGVMVNMAADFEKAMITVAGLTDSTAEQFDELRASAKQLGATTKFTATEAAGGMKFLAMAGFETNEILSAIPETLNLAAAAEISMAEASDIVTNVLKGMRLEIEALPGAVDILTKAFTSANTNLVQLGQAMKFVGPVAAAAGVPLADVTAILGTLGNAGIQSSMAGTTLRRSILKLAKPTKASKKILDDYGIAVFNAGGEMRDFISILDDVAQAQLSLTEKTEIFGIRSIAGLDVLLQKGAPALREFSQLLSESGGLADRLAKLQMKGLSGALLQLKARFEAVAIEMGDQGILGLLTHMALRMADFLRWVAATHPQIAALGIAASGLAVVLGPLIIVVGALASAFGTLVAFIFSPIGAVTALTIAFLTFREEIFAIMSNLWEFIKEVLITRFGDIPRFVGKVLEKIGDGFKWLLDQLRKWVPDFVATIEAGVNAVMPQFDKIEDGFEGLVSDLSGLAEDAKTAIMTKVVSAYDFLIAKMAEYKISSKDLLTIEARRQDILDELNGLLENQVKATGLWVDVTEDLRDSWKDLRPAIEDAMAQFITDLARGEASFRNFTSVIIGEIAKIAAAQASAGLLAGVLGPLAVAAGGAIAGGIGSLFAGPAPFGVPGGRIGPPQSPAGPLQGPLQRSGVFARGGIVHRPTLGLVGEAGPEAIVPLSQLGGMGGDIQVVINNNLGVAATARVREERRNSQRQITIMLEAVAANITQGGIVQRAIEQTNDGIERRGVQR